MPFSPPASPGSAAAPEVSVLMAVHNGERYLESALRSVMEQTLREIEIVVVDDCSTDATPQILASLATEDPRIRILTTPQNLRLAGALNVGLEQVRAPLIARMDADDLCVPHRLEVQKRFMDTHPEITLTGTSIDWIDEHGALMRRSVRGRDSFTTRWVVRFFLSISHPTFMFRPTLPDGTPLRYDAQIKLSQDHELLSRLLLNGAQIACLPDVLLSYRVHGAAVSVAKRDEQRASSKRLCTEFQRRTLPPEVFDALASVRACYFDNEAATPARIAACFAGARTMLAHDIAEAPARAAWLRRQTVQFLAWVLQRGGASKGQIARAFLRHGPDMLPAMTLRLLETKGWMPAALHSDPDVWAPAPAT